MSAHRLKRVGAVGGIAFLFFLAKGLIWLAVGAATMYAMP